MSAKPMTEGSPAKHIIKFALPIMIGALLQQLYNTVDTIIVGRFSGQDVLSAVGTTGTFVFLFIAISLGFSSGSTIVVAQHFGAGDEKRMRKASSTGILLLLLMGLIATILSISSSKLALTHFVSVPQSILKLSMQYFIVYCTGLIFQFAYNIFAGLLRAVGDSASTLYFLLISSIINIALDLLFVAVFHWGVIGAAAATVISQIIAAACAYIYMVKKYPVFSFEIKEFKWDKFSAKQTLSVGFPIALQLCLISIGLTFIQKAVNGFGVSMTASFTVGQRIEMYINLPSNAFQTTLATYVGQNVGAKKIHRVKKGVQQTTLISLAITTAISTIIWIFANNIIKLFGISGEAAVFCNQHLKAISIVHIILASYVPIFGVIQGANHSGIATIISCFALSTRVIITYALRYSEFFGHTIIWWNGLFGFGVGALLTWGYYFSGKWKKNSTLE